MTTAEQYFPRGGNKPKLHFNERKKFDFLGNADRIGKKRKYRAPKINLEDDGKPEDDGYLSDASLGSDHEEGAIKSISAEGLSLKTIQEGMVLLGRVMSISDTKIQISLPGKIVGNVLVTHISTPYTQQLKSFVDGNVEEIRKPSDLFRVGEYVSVKVMSKASAGKRTTVGLSLTPQDVNSGIHYSNLKEGMLLRGAISSTEDHGYVVDLGIANVRSFMPKKFTDDSLPLDVGQVIWCMVKKCQASNTNSIVTLTNSLEKIKSSSISGNAVQNYNVNNLKPGMALSFTVNKPLPDGMEGVILQDTPGYVHISQIGSKLKVGQSVNARVMYVMPISRLPFLTTRKIFSSYLQDVAGESSFKVGDICEGAKITKVTKKCVIVKLGKREVGLIKLKETEDIDLEREYPIGGELRVRVLSYNLADYTYLCTDDEDVLDMKHFHLSDLSTGDIVDAVVEEVQDKFVAIKVGNLKGRIPELYVSDFGILRQDKKPGSKVSEGLLRKKFKPGQSVQVRVLKVSQEASSFAATVKPSLMDPNIEVLSRTEDAVVGKQYVGVIVSFMQYGVLVGFFGDVKAVVHISQLSHEYITDIQAAFNIGQVVKCTMTSVEGDRMSASLIQQPSVGNQTQSQGESKQSGKKRKSEALDDSSKHLEETVNDKKSKKLKKGANIDTEAIDQSPTDKKSKKHKKDANINTETTDQSPVESSKKKKQKQKEKESVDKDISTVESKKKKNEIVNDDTSTEEFKKRQKQIADDKKSNDASKKKQKENGVEIFDQEMAATETKKSKKQKEKGEKKVVKEMESTETKKSKKQKKQELIVEDISAVSSKKNKSSNECESEAVKKKNKSSDESTNSLTEFKFSSINNFFDVGASSDPKTKEDTSSSDSEDEKGEKSKKKKKKLSAAEKVEKAREEEEKLRAIERELAESSSQPKSSDQFERLLLANPNSSELWIAYMAFHLQATEIEKARSVGQRALKTISFREEQDKLNVWLALLNLENRFGTQESLSHTLTQALQYNDPYSVHSGLLGMYVDTGKERETLGLVDHMLSKYRGDPRVYTITGGVCYRLNSVEKARSIMQKAINRLDNKTHIPVLLKFAHLENSRGDSERAEALFEQIVGCFPKRTDIWCAYVDMLVKSDKIDSVRLVLERAVSQKQPLKSMKLLYKKWLDVEEKLGDAEHAEKVRRMAVEYINKTKS